MQIKSVRRFIGASLPDTRSAHFHRLFKSSTKAIAAG